MGNKRFRLSKEEQEIINEHRGENVSVNGNTALDIHLAERGIDKDDVVSVKHWQSASGELRFSIVTKDGGLTSTVIEDTFEPILEELREYSPTFTPIKRKPLYDPHCLVIDPSDIHVGKLASLEETGQSYDIQKAVSQVDEGLDGLLSKASGFPIDKIFFIIGNDILHIDSTKRTTTSGTPQDTSGMWNQAFTAAKHMYVRAIEKMVPIADVHVIFNPSNHDYMSGWMLAQTLEAYFRLSKNITGVTVEYLRTPSPADSWHHRNGYIGAKKAVELFVHSKSHGQVARITHNL